MLSNKVSDAFIRFLIQELLKLVCTQVIEEFLTIFFSSGIFSYVESYTDIYGNSDIIFSGNTFNLKIKLNILQEYWT